MAVNTPPCEPALTHDPAQTSLFAGTACFRRRGGQIAGSGRLRNVPKTTCGIHVLGKMIRCSMAKAHVLV